MLHGSEAQSSFAWQCGSHSLSVGAPADDDVDTPCKARFSPCKGKVVLSEVPARLAFQHLRMLV